MNRIRRCSTTVTGLVLTVGLAACDADEPDPVGVLYGETTIVVVVNPVPNDASDVSTPIPGPTFVDVEVSTDDGVGAVTDADGIAVLAPVAPGERTLFVTGDGIDGEVSISIDDQELREVAIAADGSRVEIMSDVGYRFSDEVVEVNPEMTGDEINAALSASDVIVFFRAGDYTGDVEFAGSGVTLYGQGDIGGLAVLDGNVIVSGSRSRIRGAVILGDLSLPASDASLSFSHVDGHSSVDGSSATLLYNDLCGGATVDGSGAIALGNAGLPPLGGCP